MEHLNLIEKKSRIQKDISPPPFILYKYQVPIVKKMIEVILAGKNGLVLQPTATGKSVEAAFTARACILLHKKRGLYLYDENEGLLQARDRFEYIFGENQIFCANFFGYGKDDFVEKADMVFASFQSLNNHHEKWYKLFDQKHFDFIIVNEAHHGQAVTYKEVLDYFICSKIGMTATPERMDGKDIIDVFDSIIYEMTFEEALVGNLIADVEYHILSSNLSTAKLKEICKEVLEEGKKVSMNQLNETIFINALDETVIKEIYNYAFPVDSRSRQTLIFCENINHAENIFKLLGIDGKSAEIIHSKKSKEHNRKAMKGFRSNSIQFLVSIDKLNEDIDVPNVEISVFLRSTNSKRIFLQQLGRTLRKTKSKSTAIILDFVANVDRLLMVTSIVDRIAKEKGSDVAKKMFRIDGENFNYVFEDLKLENIFDAIKCILTKTYISDIPLLAEEYSEKNKLPANQVIAGTNKKLWWKCRTCGYEWKSSGNNRVSGTGCPACVSHVVTGKNNLFVINPRLAEEYSEKNKLPANQVIAGTNKKLWWKCRTCGYEWEASGSSRVKGSGCPACTNKVVTDKNNLMVTHPKLAEEYSEKNEFPVNKIVVGTHVKFLWKCKTCGYEWKALGSSRVKGTGCPACASQVVTGKNNLTITHPYLAEEYSKKNKLPANQVIAGTYKKILWKCKTCGHEWQAKGESRVRGTGCPKWRSHSK